MLPTTLLTVAWLAQIVAAWPQDSSSRIVGHELFAAVLPSVSNLVGPARDISNSRATPPSPQPSATTSSGAATAMASGTTTTPATTSSEKPSDTLTTISTIPSATTKFGNKVNKIATQIQPSSAPATTVSSTTTSLPPSANAIIVNISTTLLLTPTSIPITLSSLADPETPPDTTNPLPNPPQSSSPSITTTPATAIDPSTQTLPTLSSYIHYANSSSIGTVSTSALLASDSAGDPGRVKTSTSGAMATPTVPRAAGGGATQVPYTGGAGANGAGVGLVLVVGVCGAVMGGFGGF